MEWKTSRTKGAPDKRDCKGRTMRHKNRVFAKIRKRRHDLRQLWLVAHHARCNAGDLRCVLGYTAAGIDQL